MSLQAHSPAAAASGRRGLGYIFGALTLACRKRGTGLFLTCRICRFSDVELRPGRGSLRR
jgi:hypothetical protein